MTSGKGRAASVVVIVLVLLALAVPLVPADMADAQISDWIIDTPGVTLENEDKDMTKSIIIESGGSLLINHSTVTFDLTQDAAEGVLVKAGGSLTMLDSEITSRNAIFAATFESRGTFKAERSRFSKLWGNWDSGGGVRITGGNAVIVESDFFGNKRDGLTIMGGDVAVERSNLMNNVVGLRCMGAKGSFIEENFVNDNQQQGMVVIDSTATLRINTLKGNNIGIGVSNSEVNLEYNDVRENTVGIDIAESSKATLKGNEVLENTETGIRITSSSATITEEQVSSNGNGVHATGGNLRMSGSDLIGNTNAIVARGTSGEVKGNDIGGSSGYGMYLVGCDLDILDNTYSVANTKGRLAEAWVFQVYVERKDEPLEGANVTIQAPDGARVLTTATNESGLTETVELVVRIVDNSGGETSANPYTLKVRYKSSKGSRTVDVTRNMTYEVSLSDEEDGGGGLPLSILLLVTGVVLIVVSVGLALHLKFGRKRDEGPKPKSKRERRSKRGGRRRAIRSTSASRDMRVRKGGRKRRGGGRKR